MNGYDGIFDRSIEDALQTPAKHIKNLTCCVGNCAYNDGDGYCTAGGVSIGPGYASSCTDTACATFRKRS